MEVKRLNLLAAVCFLLVSGCEKVDLRGMFLSYGSVNDRFEQSMAWNQLNPYKEIIASDNEYELFAMADSHVGGVNNLNTFINEALNFNALAIAAAGDLTTGREKDYRVLHDLIINAGSINFFPVAGNHELYFNGWKVFYSLFGSSTYYFTVRTSDAADIFICLDSGSGTLGSRQLKWLKEILEQERTKYRHCVIFTHNNFFRTRQTATTNPLVEELHIIMELFLIHQVDMIVTGHDHKRSVITFGNTRYIIMDALLDGYKEAGYLRLFVNNDSIAYQFVDL